jgi:hypothetical protein
LTAITSFHKHYSHASGLAIRRVTVITHEIQPSRRNLWASDRLQGAQDPAQRRQRCLELLGLKLLVYEPLTC